MADLGGEGCEVALAWNWEHDVEVAADLAAACARRGVAFRSVPAEEVDAVLAAAADPRWRVLLDRAWESDPRFRILNDRAGAAGTRLVNAPALSARLGDKAAVNGRLLDANIPVPRQISCAPGEWDRESILAATAGWRRPIWLKPACGGGGDGVIALAEIPQSSPLGAPWRHECCVLQEDASPVILDGRPAWFRIVFVFGTVHAFWWHPRTHAFHPLAAESVDAHDLGCVLGTAATLAATIPLEFFSCEISLTAPGVPLVVDPVNDPVDLRRLSRAADGIPDVQLAEILELLAAGLVSLARASAP